MRMCDSQLFLSGRSAGLAGADPYCLIEISNQDFSVTDLSRPGDIGNRFEDRLEDAVIDSDLEFDPGPELRLVYFGDGHALNP